MQAFQALCVTLVCGPALFDISEETLDSYSAYTATGELYDRAVIEKNFEDGSKIITQKVLASKERQTR